MALSPCMTAATFLMCFQFQIPVLSRPVLCGAFKSISKEVNGGGRSVPQPPSSPPPTQPIFGYSLGTLLP